MIEQARVELDAQLAGVSPLYPGVVSLELSSNHIMNLETFPGPFELNGDVSELAELELHSDGTWTLYVATPDTAEED
jgi:hypothetical protein